jgi:integrase
VVHDFRRTVRTHLARLKVPEVVAELVLGHALRGIAGTYNVYDFEAEKRDALTRWATELTA